MAQHWRVLWTAPVDGVEALAIDGDRLYVATPTDLAALEAGTGRVLWATEVEGDAVTLTVEDDGIVVHRSPGGTYAFDTETGNSVEALVELDPAPVTPSDEPEGVTFENGDEGLTVVDVDTGTTTVELAVEWPQFEPGPLLVAGDRAFTGLADGRLVALQRGDGTTPPGPPSTVIEGLSVALTGVGRVAGSVEDDRHHRAAVVRWLVEDVVGLDVEPGTEPMAIIGALEGAVAVAGTPTPPEPGTDVEPAVATLYGALDAVVQVVGDQSTPVPGELLRRLVFDPPGAGGRPAELAWSSVAGPAAQAAFASGVRAAVDKAGVDPAALPPFTGDQQELVLAVVRAVFADEASVRDPLTAALRAADTVDGWEGGAFEAAATGDWDSAVAQASAEAGDRLLVRYPQMLDTTAALLAVAVVLRQVLGAPDAAEAVLTDLRASGERLLASLSST